MWSQLAKHVLAVMNQHWNTRLPLSETPHWYAKRHGYTFISFLLTASHYCHGSSLRLGAAEGERREEYRLTEFMPKHLQVAEEVSASQSPSQ